jgi:branched-chain amino acid transport system permease protein
MVTRYLRRFYTSFATYILDIPPRLLVFLLFLLALSIPLLLTGNVMGGDYYLRIFILANVNALFAASWDILVGRAGQISLGHALFFGIGAYSSAIFATLIGLPPWITLALSVPFGVLAAFLVGFPSMRVKGPYLALVSLAFPLILIRLSWLESPINIKAIMGGDFGIQGIPKLISNGYSPLQVRVFEYYFSLLLLCVGSIVLYKIARSKTGIVFVSILDDELASKASGINTTKYKLLAFAISAFFASLAGGFYAHFMTGADLSTLLFGGPSKGLIVPGSFTVVIMTIFGGIGTIYGPIVGAYILSLLPLLLYKIIELVSNLTNLGLSIADMWNWTFLIYIVSVVGFVVAWQKGIAAYVVEKLDELTETEEIRKDRKKGKKGKKRI